MALSTWVVIIYSEGSKSIISSLHMFLVLAWVEIIVTVHLPLLSCSWPPNASNAGEVTKGITNTRSARPFSVFCWGVKATLYPLHTSHQLKLYEMIHPPILPNGSSSCDLAKTAHCLSLRSSPSPCGTARVRKPFRSTPLQCWEAE